MPIVEGRFETKLSTVFSSADEGLDEIKKKVQRSRKIRISNVPLHIIDRLRPLLANKDLKIVLPCNVAPDAGLRELGTVAVGGARIFVDYRGREANSGSVAFSDRVFNIVWDGDEVLEVTSMDYLKCARCLNDTFETSWHYAKK